MTTSEKSDTGGVGFLTLLGLLFIGLKLGGVIAWSWGWVLLPLYGPLVIGLVVFAIIAIVAGNVLLRK